MLLNLLWKNLRERYWRFLLNRKGVEVGRNVILNGRPIIERKTGAIKLGDNVILRSKVAGYHASIYAPTRLMTDTKEDATIEIGDNTRLNGVCIHATQQIVIGKNCLIAANVTILDSDGHGLQPDERHLVNPVSRPVIIDDNVWIALNSIVLKGVHIGKNSVIGAGSVVSSDIPANSIAIGNPARVIKRLDAYEH